MRPALEPALLAGFPATQASRAEAPAALVSLQRNVAALSAIDLAGPTTSWRAQRRQAFTLPGER